jgi:phosphonatase-like hydrolase
MMKVKLVIFDISGTLIEDNGCVYTAYRKALLTKGVTITQRDVNNVMGMAKPFAIRQLLEKYLTAKQITPEMCEDVQHVFTESMISFYQNDPAAKEIEGAADVLFNLKKHGITIGLDTGFSRPIADVIIERFGWKKNFLIDACVSSDEVKNGRPAPDLAFKVMELTGIKDSKQVVKVGDTPSDLGEGKAAGCLYNVGVTSGAYSREELIKYEHTHILESVRELPEVLHLFQ